MKHYVQPDIEIIDVNFDNISVTTSKTTTFEIPGMEWEESTEYRSNLWNNSNDEE